MIQTMTSKASGIAGGFLLLWRNGSFELSCSLFVVAKDMVRNREYLFKILAGVDAEMRAAGQHGG